MADIFISYKREEKSVAQTLAHALEQQGWDVWWDPKLQAGEHFDDAIQEALDDSDCVIVLWSKLSVRSRFVRDEATYALKKNKLIPVSIADIELPELSFRFAKHSQQQVNVVVVVDSLLETLPMILLPSWGLRNWPISQSKD